MPKAVMTGITYHANDPGTPSQVLVLVTFRFLGLADDLGTLDAMVTIISTDTPATITTKIQTAVVARAAEYGVTITAADIIPVTYGVPQSLMSPANSSTLTMLDDGVDQSITGSLGNLKIYPASVNPFISLGGDAMGLGFSAGYMTFYQQNLYGTDDFIMSAGPPAGGYTVFNSSSGLGLLISTLTNTPIIMLTNATERARFDSGGMAMPAGVKVNNVAKQTYSSTNHSDDRSFNETSTTVTELAHVLGTLINDMRTIGLVA
jgi:hypothetical protein